MPALPVSGRSGSAIISLLLLFSLLSFPSCRSIDGDRGEDANGVEGAPRILIVIAHPDDESGMAATIYRVTKGEGGVADLALVTNGEGGYKYSTLGNVYYGVELTDEETGRKLLPEIRKKELKAGGEIIGIRDYYFFDQQDHMYTLNVDSTFGYVWDTAAVTSRLVRIMREGSYDYVFTLLPTPGTHGHHKGATILALRAASQLPAATRPVVLGVSTASEGDSVEPFRGLDGYPITAISGGLPSFEFDRTAGFGFRNNLNYKIVVNWLIAEHKSQGTMQLGVNRGDREEFWWYDMNDRSRFEATRRMFMGLAEPMFAPVSY